MRMTQMSHSKYLATCFMFLSVLSYLPFGAFAQSSSTTFCADNSTLSITINDTRCIDDSCREFSRTTAEFCPNGCDSVTNACAPDQFVIYAIVIGAIIGFIVVIAVIVRLAR